MAYLMHIGFDNNKKLWRNVFYFEYKGIRFKLIQNMSLKWSDMLLTIVSDDNHAEWKGAKERAYGIASEFLATLCWENNAMVKLGGTGGGGVPENFSLRKAKASKGCFREIPYTGRHPNYNITKIPHIEKQEQRDALVLFRDACSCNNNYLAFVFFWQVLNVENKRPVKWVDDAYQNKRRELCLTRGDVERLEQFVPRGESIGKYLREACRNAIAHIPDRKPGAVKVKLDSLEDNGRIIASMWIVREFARLYIRDELDLQKKMYLVRKRGKGFPVYVSEEYLSNGAYVTAYRKPSMF